jgi:biopolymer transport protein TolQ
MDANSASTGALSFIQLFLHADWVVKGVMSALILASLISWAQIIQKVMLLGKVNKEADHFENTLSSGRPLDDIAAGLGTHPKEPFQRLLVIVTSAWRDNKGRNLNGAQGDILIAQADRELNHVISTEAENIESGLSLLAVIATASPFIGLFGTVWGIMNSFSAIASQGNTNLATVAPAISEALFATAMGLGAAIPAYIAFNLFNSRTARFVTRMEGFADELMVSLTRRIGDKIAS